MGDVIKLLSGYIVEDEIDVLVVLGPIGLLEEHVDMGFLDLGKTYLLGCGVVTDEEAVDSELVDDVRVALVRDGGVLFALVLVHAVLEVDLTFVGVFAGYIDPVCILIGRSRSEQFFLEPTMDANTSSTIDDVAIDGEVARVTCLALCIDLGRAYLFKEGEAEGVVVLFDYLDVSGYVFDLLCVVMDSLCHE